MITPNNCFARGFPLSLSLSVGGYLLAPACVLPGGQSQLNAIFEWPVARELPDIASQHEVVRKGSLRVGRSFHLDPQVATFSSHWNPTSSPEFGKSSWKIKATGDPGS